MFPLGGVLLPGQLLPLHVFEPRYRRLVQDCIERDPAEFGVVLIERGSEVGGGDQRSGLGTIARILRVADLGDGRYAVVAAGMQRCRVLAWLPDDPYPLADVEPWPDEAPDDPELGDTIAALHPRVRRAVALAVELGDATADAVADPGTELSSDPLVASYQLSGLAPLGPADHQALLGTSGPRERLALLAELLDGVEAVQQFRLGAGDTGADDA